MSEEINFRWNADDLEIRTKSVEKTLEPLITHVTTLTNEGPSGRKKGQSKKADVLISLVQDATENFVKQGESIARENPEVQSDMMKAVGNVRKSGDQLRFTSMDFSQNPCSSESRVRLVKSARILLTDVTRLLILADMVDVYRLLKSLQVYFMTKFPEPPLERLPTVVMGECRRGFIPCLKRVDELIGVNFTRKDLFMVRTAASYYMCWYTMLLEPMLAKFHKTCHIPYVIPDLAEDYRGFDSQVFECAYHNFCPDPCCGLLNRISTRSRDYRKFVNRPYVRGTSRYKSECNSLPDYPCGFAAGGCRYDAKRNRNFRDLIANKFNLTCSCLHYRKGFMFDSHFRMCVGWEFRWLGFSLLVTYFS